MNDTGNGNFDTNVVSINAKLGRPLRVLHIGNIANNAYNNARIQRQYGIEADVICYDYYHIMSCPEWEDGTFTGEVGGNFPDWFATSLKGFSRPEWFVQGPADLCLQYLRARHLKMGLTKILIRSYMIVHYWRILDDLAALEGRTRPPAPWHMRWTAWLVEMMGMANPIDHDAAAIARLRACGSVQYTQWSSCNNIEVSAPASPGAEPFENAETNSPSRKVFLGRSRAIVRHAVFEMKIRAFNWLFSYILQNKILAKPGIRLRVSATASPGAEPVENAETNSPSRKVFLGRSRAIVRHAVFEMKIHAFNWFFTHILQNKILVKPGIRLWLLYRWWNARPVFSPEKLDAFLKSTPVTDTRQDAKGASVLALSCDNPPATTSIRSALVCIAGATFSKMTSMLLSVCSFITSMLLSVCSFMTSMPFTVFVHLKRRFGDIFRSALKRKGDEIQARFARIQSKEEREARIPIYLERRAEFIAASADADASVQEQMKIYTDYLPLRFFDVMKNYDIIQGYSIDGFIPYMNGLTNFIAYEHGTIRDLPWEPSLAGIVAAKVYREAPFVFVTNSDVLPSVDRLALPVDRVVCLPHAFDDAKLRSFRDVNLDLQPPPGPPIFFSPTRHHWKDKSGSWTKGNDVFLHAAGLLAREGYDFRLVLVEWGNEVVESRELIDNLGLTDKVTWVPTMQKRELWTRYCTSHAVIDQFTLPALGGVGFEAMALGRRLITALDEAQTARFFGQVPPCLISQTVGTCRDMMLEVILDPEDEVGLGAAARQWIIDYHSAQRIVSLQAKAYKQLLGLTSEPSSAQPC